ncbi:hypothetical protein GGP89_003448 [Salinibacter ruber]|nr:hypothetical protein [Salinibacter ruber]
MMPFVSGAVFKPTVAYPYLMCYHHRGRVCSVNNKNGRSSEVLKRPRGRVACT